MKVYMSPREIESIAERYNMTYQDVMQVLNIVDYEAIHENQKIMDRINMRLQGVYVAPAWVEALRRK